MAVCFDCIELLPTLGPNCHRCAYPLPDNKLLICGSCIKQPPHFNRTFIHYSFEEPLRTLLHQFKYNNGLYLSSFLCHLILRTVLNQSIMPQCLIPVPMHSKRIRSRGFNQAAILAKSLSKQLKIPYDVTSCKKILNTEPQASLNRKQRRNNLRGAFETQRVPYEHIAIVDDLLTTGSTAQELAGLLKKLGVQQVDVWCCARAIEK